MYARCLRTVSARAHSPARRLLSTTHVELSSASAPPPAGPSAETNDDLLNTVSQSIIRNATGLQPQIVEPKLDKETEITPNSERRSLHKDARAAMVKVEHGIKSLPIGLAIVQEVERRFGKLRDFKLLPDKDAPGDYLPYLFVEFENIHSLQRAHELGHKAIKVTVEPWNREQMVDGGVSLFDVQDYLRRPIPVDENAFEDIKASESVPEVALETNFDTFENPDIELTEESHDEVEGDAAEAVGEKSDKPRRPRNQINIQVIPLGEELKNQSFNSVNFPRHMMDDTRFLGTRSQTRFGQAFLQWGGFHPGYDFSEAGMEALAWRAHPYEKEPPSLVMSQAQMSGYDLQNAYLDTEVERARRMNKAQVAMKATMFKRRLMLKDSGAPPEVHGLVFDDAKNSWQLAESAKKPTSSKAGELDFSQAKPEEEAPSTSDNDGVFLRKLKVTAEMMKDNAEVQIPGISTAKARQSQQQAKKSKATIESSSSSSKASKPTSSSSPSPPLATSSTSPSPSLAIQKNGKQKSKRKTDSSPSKPSTTSPASQTVVKAQTSRSKSQSPVGQSEQVGNDGFRSKLLGWLKGKW